MLRHLTVMLVLAGGACGTGPVVKKDCHIAKRGPMTIWNKLDSGLSSAYSDYLGCESGDRRLLVGLFYRGELADIERLGFHTVFRGPKGYATGDIVLSDIERIAAHPGVVRMSFGEGRDEPFKGGGVS